jgi:hypothetical protein
MPNQEITPIDELRIQKAKNDILSRYCFKNDDELKKKSKQDMIDRNALLNR